MNRDINKFDEIFRERLLEHQLNADERNWEAINKKIRVKKYLLLRKLSLYSGAAAAIILAVILIFSPKEIVDESVLISSSTEEPVTVINRSDLEASMISEVLDESKRVGKSGNERTESQKGIESAERGENIKRIESAEKTEKRERTEIENTDRTENIERAENAEENKNQVRSIYDEDFRRQNFGEFYDKEQRRSTGWEIGPSLSSSTASLQESTPVLVHSAPGIYSNAPFKAIDNINELVVNNVGRNVGRNLGGESNTKYSSPVSVGISVRKYLNDYLAVESGIIYTYLSVDRAFPSTDGHQDSKLHYIGIPLSLSADIWNINDKFRVYLSAGGAMEKGLLSKYTETNITSRGSNINSWRTIPGVQWSVNASVGVSYNLARMIGIYVEPRYSYYFDNDQPISIRTEKRGMFGINAGIRFLL